MYWNKYIIGPTRYLNQFSISDMHWYNLDKNYGSNLQSEIEMEILTVSWEVNHLMEMWKMLYTIETRQSIQWTPGYTF